MDRRTAAELLYDSEATLRLVDNALDELQLSDGVGGVDHHPLGQRCAQLGLPELEGAADPMLQVYWEVQSLAETLRETRGSRAIEEEGAAGSRAGEASNAERVSDHLDRALETVDRLDSLEPDAGEDRSELHAEVRDAIRAAVQMLAHYPEAERGRDALEEVESCVARILQVFEPKVVK